MESCGSCEAVVEEQGQCQQDYCGYECVESGLESPGESGSELCCAPDGSRRAERGQTVV